MNILVVAQRHQKRQLYTEAEMRERHWRGEQSRASAALEGAEIADAFVKEIEALERSGYTTEEISALLTQRHREKAKALNQR